MGALTTVLGAPRTQLVRLKNGTEVTIRELSIAETWPYINGAAVDPDVLIRAAVVDDDGNSAIAPQDGIPLAQALELLPYILEVSGLESGAVPEVAELKADFLGEASVG